MKTLICSEQVHNGFLSKKIEEDSDEKVVKFSIPFHSEKRGK